MALLEAMLFHQQEEEEDLQFSYGNNSKDLYALLAATATATCYDNHHDHKYLLQQDASSCGGLYGSSSPENYNSTSDGFFAAPAGGCFGLPDGPPATGSGRRKRRRTKSLKNKEELENQRMTHITVERNRRKQMNQYLAVLRSMMPPSYVQRGDQGSIVGGAINYVKELEHLLQTLEAEKQINGKQQQQPKDHHINSLHSNNNHSILSDFFAHPQYCTRSSTHQHNSETSTELGSSGTKAAVAADVEVTMVEGHANVKVQSRRRPKQLLKLVVALHSLRLTVLHLNVITHHLHALYSFSVKVEEDCELSSVNEIAAAVHEMVRQIHRAAAEEGGQR